jgi:ATP-dependent RNA helicase RhlE
LQDFHNFGLAAPLVAAAERLGYAKPTPIQAQAIPALMAGRDLIGIAQTGTGKTAAFALPILHHLIENPRPAPRGGARALVLCPTRELASQIAQSFKDLSGGLPLAIAVVFGGVPHGAQIKALGRGLDVLVATPGRLVDHMDARVARLGETEFLVLDEVDRMLDLGFVKSIHRIVRDLPRQRHNLFFSATMPGDIRKLASGLLRDPVEVSVTPVAKTADRIEQRVIYVDSASKRDMLVELFKDEAMSRTLVFTRTKRGADRVARALDEAGISALAIHGNKSQGQRERALAAFRAGAARALVATDIAARGIDIDGVTHVVNFEMPEVAEAYVHRIGRTARAGAAGAAISLCDASERELLHNVERLTRLRIASLDRRGANRPAPAPIVRRAAPPAATPPHRAPRKDSRARSPAAKLGQPHQPHQPSRERPSLPAFLQRGAPPRGRRST